MTVTPDHAENLRYDERMQERISTSPPARLILPDQIRALAVVLMIFFHFCYDLRLLEFIPSLSHWTWLWWWLPRLIVTLFLFTMGLSLHLAHVPHFHHKSYFKRVLQVSFAAALVSLGTYLTFKETWVYFGTLHSIALCSLLAYPFIGRPRLALVVGVLILSVDLSGLYSFPWWQLPHKSMDYIPPLPWLGSTLLGLFAAPYIKAEHRIFSGRINRPLRFLGRHSLVIYLVHQPLLIGCLMIVKLLLIK
jgi:uncharacterized membrane protein